MFFFTTVYFCALFFFFLLEWLWVSHKVGLVKLLFSWGEDCLKREIQKHISDIRRCSEHFLCYSVIHIYINSNQTCFCISCLIYIQYSWNRLQSSQLFRLRSQIIGIAICCLIILWSLKSHIYAKSHRSLQWGVEVQHTAVL